MLFFNSQVDQVDPPFPRPTAHWWFGCKNTPSSFNTLGNVKEVEEEDPLNSVDVGDLVMFDTGE